MVTKAPLILAVCVLLAGAAYSLHLGDAVRYADERAYLTIADNVPHFSLDGNAPTALWPPAWPVALALVGADPLAGRLINFAMLAGVVLMAARLAGPWASALVALYPALFYTAGTLYPQTLALFLLALALLGLRDAWPGASVGLILGALVLTAPLYAFVPAVVAIWRPRVTPPLILSVAMVVAPWCVRSGCFVSANGGYVLLLGNNAKATAGSGPQDDISVYLDNAPSGELERDRYFRRAALSWITANPSDAFLLYLAKLANHFHFRNDLATAAQSSGWKDAAMLLTYGPILLLALWRVASGRLSSVEKLALAVAITGALAQATFFTRVRYRLPLDLCLILLAAPVLQAGVGSLSRKLFHAPVNG